MKKIIIKSLTFAISLMLCASIFLPATNYASAAKVTNLSSFLGKYSDWHFDLSKDPDRVMTNEEFIAIIYAYSYQGNGNKNTYAADKNGRNPSAWCSRYVREEVKKGVVEPKRISWSDPVTLAFAAKYMVRSKGKYSYDATNVYSFSGTQGMSADDILYVCSAIDHGLIAYTQGMDISRKITRREARSFEIPEGPVYATQVKPKLTSTPKNCNAYFVDSYWQFPDATRQFKNLKTNASAITMVTFQCGYLNTRNIDSGNRFLGCDIEHTEAITSNPGYDHDPQTDAIRYCKEKGKLALLGISNAADNGFSGAYVKELLSSKANMQTGVNEIMSAVRKYNLDGVNLGIEVTEKGYSYMRAGYTEFVKMLSSSLHAEGKKLLVSMGAYFTDAEEQSSIYNYWEIGNAADFVHLILYDDFTDTGFISSGKHGPISNLKRIGRCLRYASVKMNPGKILLGMGSYATDFNFGWGKAEDISYDEAEALRAKYGAKLVYDSTNGAAGAYFEYTDSVPCRHRVYMESPDTAKMRAVEAKNYGIGGFSVYSLDDNNTPLYENICDSFFVNPFAGIGGIADGENNVFGTVVAWAIVVAVVYFLIWPWMKRIFNIFNL